MTELFVICWKGTNAILDSKSLKEYRKSKLTESERKMRYTDRHYSPSKKVYYSLGYAENALRFIPDELIDKLEIIKFIPYVINRK